MLPRSLVKEETVGMTLAQKTSKCLAVFFASLLVSRVIAAPLNWQIDKTFASGDVVLGSFTYDADINSFSDIDVTYTESGVTHRLSVCSRSCSARRLLFASELAEGAPAIDFILQSGELTNAGGTKDSSSGAYSGRCSAQTCENLSISKAENFDQPFSVIASGGAGSEGPKTPPYSGTSYIDSGWVDPDDVNRFKNLSRVADQQTTMFDRRTNDWITVSALSYEASFHGTPHKVYFRLNPEFSGAQTDQLALIWAEILGKTPIALIEGLGDFHLQPGEGAAGGNAFTDPTHVLIHAESGQGYINGGYAEDIIIHELGHANFQALQDDADWIEAQQADACFISTYAADNPTREDLAESLAPYLMIKYRPTRVSPTDRALIENCIPHRMEVFDRWFLSMDTSFADWDLPPAQELFNRLFAGIASVRGSSSGTLTAERPATAITLRSPKLHMSCETHLAPNFVSVLATNNEQVPAQDFSEQK